MPVQRPLGPQYGTSSEQIAQMAAMISSARSGGEKRSQAGVSGDMTEYMRGELEAQRSSRVGTAIQKATMIPGSAMMMGARMPNIDKIIEKVAQKTTKAVGAGAGMGGTVSDYAMKGLGAGYMGMTGIMNVPMQKRLAYEKQYQKQLGGVGTASSALSSLSMANRSLALPRVLSMLYGGGMPRSLQGSMGMYTAGKPMAKAAAGMTGVNLPAAMTGAVGEGAGIGQHLLGGATGMAPMLAASLGLSMMKARKMKKITAQRKSGGAEEAKFSLSSQLEAQINQLAASGTLQPGDQLKIQLLRWVESHTSVLPEIWAEQKYIREEKEKGGTAASQAYGKAMGEKSDQGVISSIVSGAEKFTTTRLAKYDIFGQLFNFLSTGKLPKQFQEELEMAYGTGESFKEAKERSKERGIGIAQTRLLEMTGRQVVDMAPNYETKMLTVLSASFDVHRYIGSELLTIRKQGFGIPDAAIKSEDYESSALGKVWNLLKSPGEMLTNIPGFNAIWNIIKMPFGIGNTVREGAKGIWGGVRKFMMGGEDTMELLESDEALRKKAGIYKSKQDMANDFMGRGLPNVMEETRALGWRQLTELINIYGVLTQIYQTAAGGRAAPFRQEPFSSQAKIGIWSPSAGKFVDEKGLADQQKQDKDRMQIALEDAFKGSGMDRIGWFLQKFTGETTVEERLAGAAGRVRGIEAAPYGWAEKGQERGGLMGLMQMVGASPFIDVAEGLTLTPEEQIISALYSQRAVKGRGRAAMAPGWFGKEQARRQMGLERDIFPQFQRGGAKAAGGLVGGLGMAGIGGAASLLSGGALLPLMMGMGVGGMAGAVPQNIMEFMQTKRVFEGISGEDIARVTAGYATMPKLDSKTREQVISYYKNNFPKEYSQLGIGDAEFFEDITNLPYIQLAMSAGTPIGEMLTDFDKAVSGGLVDYKGGTGTGAPGGMFGLFDGMQKGTIDPLPVQIADVSEEMIFKFPGLFLVSDEWKKIQAIAKDKDDDERKREEEKAKLRKEAQEMKKLSAADRQKLIDSKTVDKQALLEEQWDEYVSPTVKRLRPGSRASQRLIEKEWSQHEQSMDDTELEKPHRGVIGKIIDFMEYRKSKKPRDPSKWGEWLERTAGVNKMAAAEGGVVGQTGLAYVHEGEVIGGPQLLWKIMTGTAGEAVGAAGAFGRGVKGELSELKQKLKETRMFNIFETIRDKLTEIDENTEGTDENNKGMKSGKKKGMFGLSSIGNFLKSLMGMLPILVPMMVPLVIASMMRGDGAGTAVAKSGGFMAGVYAAWKTVKWGAKKLITKGLEKGKGILGFGDDAAKLAATTAKTAGTAAEVAGTAGKTTGILSKLVPGLKVGGKLLGKLAIPITLVMGAWDIVTDAIKGWKEDGLGGALKQVFMGDKEGGFMSALKGMGKYAAIGAGIGIIGGPPGMLAGALIGTAVGGIIGFLGQDRMEAIGGFLKRWTGGDLIQGLFKSKYANMFAGFGSPFPIVGPFVGGIVGSIVDSIALLFSEDPLGKLIESLKDLAPDWVKKLMGWKVTKTISASEQEEQRQGSLSNALKNYKKYMSPKAFELLNNDPQQRQTLENNGAIVRKKVGAYSWVTPEEAEAADKLKKDQAITNVIKEATGKDVKPGSRIKNRLHIEAIRRYEYYKEDKNPDGIAQSTQEMSVWSDLPPEAQLKILQAQEGRLKVEAGDAPKAPPKAPDKTTAQAMSIDNEAKRLDAKKRIEEKKHKRLVDISTDRESKKLLDKKRQSDALMTEMRKKSPSELKRGALEQSDTYDQKIAKVFSMKPSIAIPGLAKFDKNLLQEIDDAVGMDIDTLGFYNGSKKQREDFIKAALADNKKRESAKKQIAYSKKATDVSKSIGASSASGMALAGGTAQAGKVIEPGTTGYGGYSMANASIGVDAPTESPKKQRSSMWYSMQRRKKKLRERSEQLRKAGRTSGVFVGGKLMPEGFSTKGMSLDEKTRLASKNAEEMEASASGSAVPKSPKFANDADEMTGRESRVAAKITGEEDYSHMMKEEESASKGGFWGKVKSFFGFGGKEAESGPEKTVSGMPKTPSKKIGYTPEGIGGKKGMVWPGSSVVTSPFGHRKTKLKQASRMHHGVDTRAIGETDDVKSVYKGVVVASGPKWGSLVVRHGEGDSAFTTHYIHLANKFVKPGDEVETGEIIGKAGSVAPYSGMAKHLHFGFKQKGKWFDPELIFKKVDPSFNPSYAKDIVPGRQLSAKLGGTEIDLSTLKEEGAEAAGPFGERYSPSDIRSDLSQRVKQSQTAKKELDSDILEQAKGKGADTAPMIVPVSTGAPSDRLNDEKDFTVADSTLDGFLNGLLRDSAYEFNNRYKNYAYQSNIGHMFT